MGLLNDILGKLTGGGGGLEKQVTSVVAGLLTDKNSGGLTGLVESFTKNGLGDVISSWVGTGKNAPVSPEQVAKGLGQDKLTNLASSLGISGNELSRQLSSILPGMVDKLTPEGKIPSEDLLKKGLEMLTRR